MKSRSKNGNMTIVVCAGTAVFGIGLIAFMSLAGTYFVQSLLQNQVNELAMHAACTLNDNDRIGQMNNLIARCRSLVYDSRQNYDTASNQYQIMETLNEQLKDEAIQSAKGLETERQYLKQLSELEANTVLQADFLKLRAQPPFTLPWLQCSKPNLVKVELGQISSVQSNVAALDVANNLTQSDQAQNVIRQQSNCYHANVKPKLPAPDDSLVFQISSLPSPVTTDVAPARLVRQDKYMPTPNNDLTCAARVTVQMDVKSEIGGQMKSTIKVVSLAAAPGGCPVR